MSRIQKVINKVYYIGLNNCEHFVTYVVKGKAESVQGDILVRLVDVAIMYFEIRFLNSPPSTRNLGLKSMSDIRRTLMVDNRNPALAKMIGEQIKKHQD